MRTLFAILAFALALCIGVRAEAITQSFHYEFGLNPAAEAGAWVSIMPQHTQPPPLVLLGRDDVSIWTITGYSFTSGQRGGADYLSFLGGENGFTLDVIMSSSIACGPGIFCYMPAPSYALASSPGLSIVPTPLPAAALLFLAGLGILALTKRRQT